MEFHGMKRKQLQALCKKHGVPANLTNRAMADRLSSLLEETQKSVVQEKSNSDGSVEVTSETGGKTTRQNVKKVRFSPVDETYVFVSSNVKNTSREKRAIRRGSSNKRSLAIGKSCRRVASVRTVQSPVRTTRSRVQKVVDKDLPQVIPPSIRKKSRRGDMKADINEVQSVDTGDTRPELGDSTNSDNPQIEVAASLRWHLRSRGVGVDKDGKVDHTTIENMRKNKRPTDLKKRKRNDTDGHLHSDNKSEDASPAFARAQQRKITRHSKRIEKRQTDLKSLIKEPEAVKSAGRVTQSRALRAERTFTGKAINENVEVQGECDKVVQLGSGQPPKIMGRRTRKLTAQHQDLPSVNDGPKDQISDNFTARIVERKKTKRVKRNAAGGSKSLLLGKELVDTEIAGSKLCSQKKSSLDASIIEAESGKSEVLEEHEEVDCLTHISDGLSRSLSRGKHSPPHKGKERYGLNLENKTRKQKDSCQKLVASEFGVAIFPVNGLPLRRSRRKAIPSAALTDKDFIAHPTGTNNVRLSPYNCASEVEASAKEQSLKTLMTNISVHNSRVSSDAPAKQKGGKAPNTDMEYSEPSTEEPRTKRQSKKGIYKPDHGVSMNSIVEVDAKSQRGSATIIEELSRRAKSSQMMDETLDIYVYLNVPAVLEHEDGLEMNGKTDKAECYKNKGSDGKAGDITGGNSFDFYGVDIYQKDDFAAQSGNALVSVAEKSQEVDMMCGLEKFSSDSDVITEKPTVPIKDDRGKILDAVDPSCQALGRAEDSIPEQVPSRAQIEDMDAVSHQDVFLTRNLDSVDEPSNAPSWLAKEPETEHIYVGEHGYSRSVEELDLVDHMNERGQRGFAERVPVYADEHAHHGALFYPSSNKEQNRPYETSEVHPIDLGLRVGTFKTSVEDVVAIQLHNSCSSLPTGIPEMLTLRNGEDNQIRTRSSVTSSLQSNDHFGGDGNLSRGTEFSSERALPEQIVVDAQDSLCTPEKSTEEPGRKQGESQEPRESVEAAEAACELTIGKAAERNKSADRGFSISNPLDAKITREKVCEVEEGNPEIASDKLLGNFPQKTSGEDLSMISRDGCHTPVAKRCFLSYENPLPKDSEKQGHDIEGQSSLLEDCFSTIGKEIFSKPVFKSASDLSNMEVGMDNQDKLEEDSTTDEDNVVHLGTASINACDDDLKDKLQVDHTNFSFPIEPGSYTDQHKETGPVMQSFEPVLDETGKSCMETLNATLNAEAVGSITSVEGIIAEDKIMSSERVALHSPNTSDHEMSSCINDVSKDNDGYEEGGNLEDEILSPVIDGTLGQDNGYVVPNYSSHIRLDAILEENRFQVEEQSFFNTSDIARPAVKTEALNESVLEVLSSRKDQALDMKEVINESSLHQVFGNLSAEKGAEINTVISRVACDSFPLDKSNALRSCHMKVHDETKDLFDVVCNTEAVTLRECLKEQNREQCDYPVEEGDSHFNPDKQAVSPVSLSSYGHKQEDLDEGGQQEEMRNNVEKMELTASSNLNFSDNQSANYSENLDTTEALQEGNFDLTELGNRYLPNAGGGDSKVQIEATFCQHGKESIGKVHDVEEEASSATVTINAVDMFNKEEDGNATSVFLKDQVQFYGDQSTKINLNTPIIPGMAAEDPKCSFKEVSGAMLHSDEQKIDLSDDRRGKSSRPDQNVPAILEYPNLSEPISADVGIYVGTTGKGLVLKDVRTYAVQFDDNKLLKETHSDEVSSRMIESVAPNVNSHVELVSTSNEDIIHTEDEPGALIMQENSETSNLEDGSTPTGETMMSLCGMSIGYEWDKKNSVGVDIRSNAEEKIDGGREEVIVLEAHEPQEDHGVIGNASHSNHSSTACREVAKEYIRDDEIASVQTGLVLCEYSCTKYERIVKDKEESHGSGMLDEPATESKQLSANANSISDFSLISLVGSSAILENKSLDSQVELQTFISSEMSFVFGDNSLDNVRKLDAEAEEKRLINGNGKNADSVEESIAKLEVNAPVIISEDLKDCVDHSDSQVTILNDTSLKIEENREDIIKVTDDEHSKDGAPFECSCDLENEREDVTVDHYSDSQARHELTVKNDKESTEQEVSAMIQEYIDREKLEEGSIQVRASCDDSREKERAHVNASDCAPSEDHLPFSSCANQNVELGIKQDKETFIPNSASYTPASSERIGNAAENVSMQQLNLTAPLTKSLDVKMEEPGKLINSSMMGRSKPRSNFIERTPKKLLVTSDMKENMTSTKWNQVGSVTASRTTKTRRVLEDIQRKQI